MKSYYRSVTYHKKFQWLPILTILCLVFVSVLFLVHTEKQRETRSLDKAQSIQDKTRSETSGFPVRLIIPKINIDTAIENVGITANGDMEVPTTIHKTGWFAPGPRPGERGSAVISGHVTGENGEAGVFARVHTLQDGDTFIIEDDTGTAYVFMVRKSKQYDPGFAEDVFSQSDIARLNLITCDGVWDEATKQYTKRLVVFADMISIRK